MLSAEQIKSNWETFLEVINQYISSPRKEALVDFYKTREQRLIMMPASYKPSYHSCFPGGYVHHVLNVVNASIKLYKVWEEMGTDMTTFTLEELIFSAINHDLGKFGTEEEAAYIPQTDEWRKDKLNEQYTFNNKIEFMSIPDRSIFLLISNGIEFSKNEMLAIKLHDGLYDDANKPYLQNWLPEQKPRTSLIFILHQADLMASRIEFEQEWLPKFKQDKPLTNTIIKTPRKNKEQIRKDILGTALTKNGNDVLNNFFNK